VFPVEEAAVKRVLGWSLMLTGVAIAISRPAAEAACCYFAPVEQVIKQPAQTAWITWHPKERMETFTVEPTFTGNARDFGMVIPTPSRPRLYEMPREFFEEMRIFTILKAMPKGKFRQSSGMMGGLGGFGGPGGAGLGSFGGGAPSAPEVRVVESGQVGSLDYKIVVAEESAELFRWLKENGLSFTGGQETLDYYLKQRWCFTVMKIDPMQQKRKSDGTFSGAVTPTRFVFATPKLVYPLRITQPNVTSETDALFYVQAPFKVDLPPAVGYGSTWATRWRSAMSQAVPEKLTAGERDSLNWLQTVGAQPDLPTAPGARPARLQWAKRLDRRDLGVLEVCVMTARRSCGRSAGCRSCAGTSGKGNGSPRSASRSDPRR
jgi:hypothetical protein